MPLGKVTLVNAPKPQSEPNTDFTPRRIVDAREYGLSLRTNMNDVSYEGKLIVALCDALMKATAPQ